MASYLARNRRRRLRRACMLLTLALLLIAPPVGPTRAAEPATLVQDLSPEPYLPGFKVEHSLTSVNGTLFFAGSDAIHGTELWKSDGTPQATALLKDVLPGSVGSNPFSLTAVGALLFFLADDGGGGRGLYRSDGTAQGTLLLRSGLPYPYGTVELVAIGGTLYFTLGPTLWKSDGTPEGTLQIMGVVAQYSSAQLRSLTPLGNLLFFVSVDDSATRLWRSDGTPEGTLELMRTGIIPSFFNSEATQFGLTALGGALYFGVDEISDSADGLWRSDGSVAGTVRVNSVVPFGNFSGFAEINFSVVGTTLFFISGGNQLWRSDGSERGTRRVATLPVNSTTVLFYRLVPLGNILLFSIFDHQGTPKMTLWRSDGSERGTQLVKAFDMVPFELVVSGGLLYFTQTEAASTLWRSDGTTTGSFPLATHPSLHNLADHSGRLFFQAGSFTDFGLNLWASDGSERGTLPVLEAVTPQGSSQLEWRVGNADGVFFTTPVPSEEPFGSYYLWYSDSTAAGTAQLKRFNYGLTTFALLPNGALLFSVNTGTGGAELWRSDGTPAGTLLLKEFTSGYIGTLSNSFSLLNELLFFPLLTNNGVELWRSDGTPEGTLALTRFDPGPLGTLPVAYTSVGGLLFFTLGGGYSETQLWRSDGTPAGTFPLRRFFSLQTSSLVRLGDALLFGADGGEGGALWRSDGTAQGTFQLQITNNDGQQNPTPPQIELNGAIFFGVMTSSGASELWKSDGSATGTLRLGTLPDNSFTFSRSAFAHTNSLLFIRIGDDDLWRSDGTPEGTFLVKHFAGTRCNTSFPNAPCDPALVWLEALDNTLFMIARDDPNLSRTLWRSDGTPEGTFLLTDSPPDQLTVAGDQLFFTTDSSASGRELWRSDGTPDGTFMLRDMMPGPESALPQDLRAAGDTLVFSAWNTITGRELWSSDGTPEGTVPVHDIAPGSVSSSPTQFYVAGSQLFMMANDGQHGREPWALPLAALRARTSTTLDGAGGALESAIDRTSYTFPAGLFSTPVSVTHTLRDTAQLPATGALLPIGHAFSLVASDGAQPSGAFTLRIAYTDSERGPVLEPSLALYAWDGTSWVREPSSTLDQQANTLTATPNRFGTWAVLGETYRTVLPIAGR